MPVYLTSETSLQLPSPIEVCGIDIFDYFEAAEKMHGNLAPGLVIGGFMVSLARRIMGEEKICDVVVETASCLPDAVQLLTPCSIGNGWMKIKDVGKYALTMYDKFGGSGVRVSIDCKKLDDYPHLKEWFLKLKPKKNQDKARIIKDMVDAGESVLSYERVKVKPEKKKSKGAIGICPGCGEAYPVKHGLACIPCQKGNSYYRGINENSANNRREPELKKVLLSEAVGLPLAHDVTRVEPDKFKGPEFSRGYVVKAGDLCRLQQMGKSHLYVMDKIGDGYLHEDDAIKEMAAYIAGNGIKYDERPREGKIDFYASYDGLFTVNVEQLFRFNLIPEVMCATRHRYTLVKKDQKVAGARAVPLVVNLEKIKEAIEIASELRGLFSVRKLRKACAGILITGNEIFQGLIQDRFEPIITRKLNELGSDVAMAKIAPDDSDFIAEVASDMIRNGCDLIVITAGLSVDPDDVTREGISKAGATDIIYGSAVLPGAMAMVARIGEVPVVGVPACGLYFERTIFDLILPRILAGLTITRYDLAEMGHGGFCLSCKKCRFPRCPFGKI